MPTCGPGHKLSRGCVLVAIFTASQPHTRTHAQMTRRDDPGNVQHTCISIDCQVITRSPDMASHVCVALHTKPTSARAMRTRVVLRAEATTAEGVATLSGRRCAVQSHGVHGRRRLRSRRHYHTRSASAYRGGKSRTKQLLPSAARHTSAAASGRRSTQLSREQVCCHNETPRLHGAPACRCLPLPAQSSVYSLRCATSCICSVTSKRDTARMTCGPTRRHAKASYQELLTRGERQAHLGKALRTKELQQAVAVREQVLVGVAATLCCVVAQDVLRKSRVAPCVLQTLTRNLW